MALYASIRDMVTRWGEAEMIRVSTPDGAEMVAVHAEPIERAIGENSALIDTYLRKRYRVPLDVAPHEVRRACCILTYYDLCTGGQKQPSEQAGKDRAEVVTWLGRIARGEVLLDLEEVAVGENSYAQEKTRDAVFSPTRLGPIGGPDDGGVFW